mmetsp:Transcript_12871/g.27425  ORF Transcript_12871/g.27425 Transcript_12871/m.27425 type:complete len:511 (+) Transcript_12871:336-1868(+)
MNAQLFTLAESLVPSSYIRQARDARRSRESLLATLLSQRRLPRSGWDRATLMLALHELAALDSNTFVGNAGVGEREGRVVCPIVADRHFGFAHGIGRSGDIAEPQPKAAGSSLLYALTNELAADALCIAGAAHVRECTVLPLATGMSMTLTLLALKKLRPGADLVLWPRIDQKSCLKAIHAAGLQPIPIENVYEGDELRTDVPEVARRMEELGVSRVLCVLSTTSCFAPRGVEKLLELARLCDAQGVPHVANNAYGVQCEMCMKAISAASRHGRLDAFVQSTDKNFLVPVGGAIVASADAKHGKLLMQTLRSTYPGRASMSPVLDLFCTLLHLGADGWGALIGHRRQMLPDFKRRLTAVAERHGERLLLTPHNSISMAVTLTPSGRAAASLGAALFVRLVSGLRVVTPTDAQKTICAIPFTSYGAHTASPPSAYFSVACALGIGEEDVSLFLKRVDKALAEWKRPPKPQRSLAHAAPNGGAASDTAAEHVEDETVPPVTTSEEADPITSV